MAFKILHIIAFIVVIAIAWGIKLMFFGEAGAMLFLPTGEDPRSCQIDSDCVPAPVCHPTTSVNRDYAEKTRNPDQICTLQCAPNTLDCGQGEVRCINNKCEAIINE